VAISINLDIIAGMVHANVGQKVSPLTFLKDIFVTYNELVMSQDHPKHITNPMNTTTMMVEPSVPTAA
jgi:hypothetical protein